MQVNKIGDPMLSVIVPVYNAEGYLKHCIESLIGQSYSNVEFVFVNDGSTDQSLDILRNYMKRDLRIKVIDQVNKGSSYARFVGLTESGGR